MGDRMNVESMRAIRDEIEVLAKDASKPKHRELAHLAMWTVECAIALAKENETLRKQLEDKHYD